MKKVFATLLIGVIVISVTCKPFVAFAVEPTQSATVPTEYVNSVNATATVLTWEMLQAYLYAVGGQQAYDVYANDEEAQERVYSDFVQFCEDTSYGARWSFQTNLSALYCVGVSGKNVLNYYKTAGSSALADVKEKVRNGMTVITGGLNNNTPSPSQKPDSDDVSMRDIQIVGSVGLTKTITEYITSLVNGKRGDVSKEFYGHYGEPEYYFDGEYRFDDMGFPCFYVNAHTCVPAYLASDTAYYWAPAFWSHRATYNYNIDDRCALLCEGLVSGNDGSQTYQYYKIGFYRKGEFHPVERLVDCFYTGYRMTGNVDWWTSGHRGLLIEKENITNISYMPIFSNKADMEYYISTGNPCYALNYFTPPTTPSEWFDFDLSEIASKLDKLCVALTTLPIITTEDLAGFVKGIQNAIVVGNVPASDPATQQQQMQEIIEENARKVSAGAMADTTRQSVVAPEYSENNPAPTLTPEQLTQNEQLKNGAIVVDLHEFFPFCVPFDFVRLIKVLQAEPKAPCFEGAIKYDKLGINVPVKLDLTFMDDCAKVCRICELMLFILSLILVTRSLIRG